MAIYTYCRRLSLYDRSEIVEWGAFNKVLLFLTIPLVAPRCWPRTACEQGKNGIRITWKFNFLIYYYIIIVLRDIAIQIRHNIQMGIYDLT